MIKHLGLPKSNALAGSILNDAHLDFVENIQLSHQ